MSLPLCFDLPATINVKLLHHPSRGLDINGEISPDENGGFRSIMINVQSDLSIEIYMTGVTVKEGQTSTHYSTLTQVTAGSVTVIIRDKDIDVSIGDVRLVILGHEISGRKFLWPVFRQLPLDDKAEGVLVVNLDYEEETGAASTVKVNGQEVTVSRSSATDYSVPVPITVDCWLLSAQAAFQRPSTHFYN
uniref:Uncharacterized protein n=1 Tax=Neogobius melanostomus TaxID=47308 RepID=A0A8C6WNR1_9GOBI